MRISPSTAARRSPDGASRRRSPRVDGVERVCRRALLLASLLGSLLPAASPASEVPFTVQPDVTSAVDNGRAVVAADLDGDADLDLLSASRDDDKIAWYENTDGAGTFGGQQLISGLADGPESVYAADLDGDGDRDVLSASSVDGEIAWYENTDGSGSFGARQVISTLTATANGVHAADVDGDGDLDVLSCSFGDNKIAWYENTNGSGAFGAQQVISTLAFAPEGIFAADVDGDGDADALSASLVDDEIAWYENLNGDGSSWTQHIIGSLADGAFSVSAADIDGDGDMDAVSASFFDGVFAWYENVGGAGTSWTRHLIDWTATGAIHVSTADVDDDGDEDVIGAANTADEVIWYENADGAGTSWTTRSIAVLNGARGVAPADLDRDGDLDVVAISSSTPSGDVVWYENRTLHRSAAYPVVSIVDASYTADRLAAADIDRDGDLDLVSIHTTRPIWNAKLAWHENTSGDGSTWTRHAIKEVAADEYRILDVTDVDGDGDVDIVGDGATGAAYPPDLVWWENTAGDGSVWTEWPIMPGAPLQQPATSVATGDIDNDGDHDILFGPGAGLNVVWAENLGGGASWATPSWWYGEVAAMALADFDANGWLGLVRIDLAATPQVTVHFDPVSGGSYCIIEGASTFYQYDPYDVLGVDVDRNGEPDVVLSDSGSLRWFDYTANPPYSCWMWTASEIGDPGDPARHLVASDVDRDGDSDLVSDTQIYTGTGRALVWWENGLAESAGWTEHSTAELGNWDDDRPVIAADLDGDGDPDIVTRTTGDDPDRILWLPNRGGQFALETTDTAPSVLTETTADDALAIRVLHRGRPGDADLELSTLELLFEATPGVPLSSAQANALIANLLLYSDDNQSGAFEPAYDTLVHSVATLSLTAGVQTLALPSGNPSFQVAQGSPERYLVVLEAAAGGAGQTPNSFRVTHLTESSSSALDTASGLPLSLEFTPNVSSSTITVPEPDAGLGLVMGILGLGALCRLRDIRGRRAAPTRP